MNRINDLKRQIEETNNVGRQFGFQELRTPGQHVGYLYNMRDSFYFEGQDETPLTVLECYFVRPNLEGFKVKVPYSPYVLLSCPEPNLQQVILVLEKQQISVEPTEREDSSAPNHVAGQRTSYLKLTFKNRFDLQTFLKQFRNERGQKILTNKLPRILQDGQRIPPGAKLFDYISRLAETDVQDGLRISIDKRIRCAKWYIVTVDPEGINLAEHPDLKLPPKLRTLAFDIETTKQPLCFPNAEQGDQVMCISYMIDGRGVLLVNRQIFSKEIVDFEYSPSEQMKGEFRVFNLGNEREMLEKFIAHIKQFRPHVIATYNGDSFDFKFIDTRCQILGVDFPGLGFQTAQTRSRFGQAQSEYSHPAIIHIDCLRWVVRDSYLPQGSQGLKAVTQKKLKYKPTELDPELMTPYARQQPQVLAQYSVSDAVATYYLYKKFIEAFIFALCTIIPLSPDDVLRRGTGTLCESLLMVEATNVGLVYPEKVNAPGLQQTYIDQQDATDKKLLAALKTTPSGTNSLPENRPAADMEDLVLQNLLDPHVTQAISSTATPRVLIQQTYAGGRVEAINSGVFRNDFDYQFFASQDAQAGYQQLMDQLDSDLEYFLYSKNRAEIDLIAVEESEELHFYPVAKTRAFIRQSVPNYEEVRAALLGELTALWEQARQPTMLKPIIYHLDVAAMYPNIILTNRLQPNAVVNEAICDSCDYNQPESMCKRHMTWLWRGIYYPCTLEEYQLILQQLQQEKTWKGLTDEEKETRLKHALEVFCQKTYKSKQTTLEQLRQSQICQRENPFFVDTVLNFRDRRYVYKREQKKADIKASEIEKLLETTSLSFPERQQLQEQLNTQKALIVLNESLQLAHKAILNSFYGYAMRTGSRWFSMQMAACVTFVGAQIIKLARALVEKIGIALELDTDGIWCMLPAQFPDEFCFKYINGKKEKFQYPAVMLNAQTAHYFSNEQNQTRKGATHEFQLHPSCTIEFEIDGPYKAMFLSAAKEEGKKIKKRYCVFDLHGKMAELKGFELKRRGELQLIKSFQQRLFNDYTSMYLSGTCVRECYEEAAVIADHFLDILYKKGQGYDQALLLELLQEATTMKNSLTDTPAGKKGAAITCARRLAASLDEVFASVSSLTCKFVISKNPAHLAVSERAIPIQIFDCPEETKAQNLSLWTGQPYNGLADLLDWDYYLERFINSLMRLIVVPAGLQGVPKSPISRIPYPDWLQKATHRQYSLDEMRVLLQKNLQDEEGGKAGEASSEDEDSSDTENDEQQPEKQKEAAFNVKEAIDALMEKNQLKVQDKSLRNLRNALKNKTSRSDDAKQWLEMQKRKWRLLIQFDQLGKSLDQIQRDTFGGNQGQRRIQSNDIMSQLQGLIKTHRYLVLDAWLPAGPNSSTVTMQVANLQSREVSQLRVLVPKQITVDVSAEVPAALPLLHAEGITWAPSQFKARPDGLRASMLVDIEMSYENFDASRAFFDHQLSAKEIKRVWHVEKTALDRLLIERGAFIEVFGPGVAEIDSGRVQFMNTRAVAFEDNTQRKDYVLTKASAAHYFLGENEKKPMRMNVQICVWLTLPQGQILIALTESQTTIHSTIPDASSDDFQVAFDAFQETASGILAESLANKGQTGAEKADLIALLRVFAGKPMRYSARRISVGSSLFEQYLFEQEPHQVVFYSSNESGKAVRCPSKSVLFSLKSQAIDTAGDGGIAQILVQLLAQVAQLERLAAASMTPLNLLLATERVYTSGMQPGRLLALDVLLARRMFLNRHIQVYREGAGESSGGFDSDRDERGGKAGKFAAGYSAFFTAELFGVYALSQASGKMLPGTKALKMLSQDGFGNCMQLAEYIGEYLETPQALGYNAGVCMEYRRAIDVRLEWIRSLAASKQISVIHLSQNAAVLQTDKLSENLAVRKLRGLLREFAGTPLRLIPERCCKALFFRSTSDYFGLTAANAIAYQWKDQVILDETLTEQAQVTLFAFLKLFTSAIEVVTPRPVSLHQLGPLKQIASDSLEVIRRAEFKIPQKWQVGDGADDLVQNPGMNLEAILSQIAAVSLFKNHTYASVARDRLAPGATSAQLFLDLVYGYFQLCAEIEDEARAVAGGLKQFFGPGAVIKKLRDLQVRSFCDQCQGACCVNVTALLGQDLVCSRCHEKLNDQAIEQQLILQVQQQFALRSAENAFVFRDWADVCDMSGFQLAKSYCETLAAVEEPGAE